MKDILNFINDLTKLDAQLVKQVQEMEDFEIQSKQNRTRLLSGMIYNIYKL